jgi:hypothetical protein
VVYNSSYTEYNSDNIFWNWSVNDFSDCILCQKSNPCVVNNISLSGCCDGLVVNVAAGYNPPNEGESATLANQTVLSGDIPLEIGACYIRIPYDVSYPDGPTVTEFNPGDTYNNCVDCVNNNTCPSPTPTPTPTNTLTPTVTPTISVTPSSSLDVVYEYFNSVSICCNSTGTPISGVVGLNSNLGLSSGDYVVINGDAYQLGTSTVSSGTEYLNASGPYTDCDDAVSNATNPCRYDMIPCCGSGSGPSYYPPFTLEIFSILTNGEAFFTTQVQPYQGITDKCMSVDTYTGNYSVDTIYPAVMQSNGNGCINRCSRCTFVVRPCGWPTNVHILWNVNTLTSMTAGTVWYDSGLSSWISTNFPGSTTLLPTNCLTILPASEGSYAGSHDGYNYTINLVSNCSDITC